MIIKYYTWFMKSRGKIDTIRGVDEHEGFVARQWTDKCKERIAKAGHACLTYLDLDADGYRTATNKITPWSIK